MHPTPYIKVIYADKWQTRWLEEADLKSKWSKDPNTKIGAVIVDERYNDLVSIGFNGIPRGVKDNILERNSRNNEEKYYWYEHAERNAIYNCVRKGVSTNGLSLFLNSIVPCAGCARAIIQSGIKRVYFNKWEITKDSKKASEKWNKSAERSVCMMQEANVELLYLQSTQPIANVDDFEDTEASLTWTVPTAYS